jgi:tRNA threonylcarbamoyladenosine biosynthesis protein TsaB
VTSQGVKLLALDTTESACSAALWLEGRTVERFEIAPRRHSELLLPMMDELLNEAGVSLGSLDAIAFARGPGSFTGLRIAASVAQGAAFGADLPVVPVSSLQALARQCCRSGSESVLAAFDARMDEVYWGAFACGEDGIPQPLSEECVCAPADVEVPEGGPWHGLGSGWTSYAEELKARVTDTLTLKADAQVHAADVAAIAAAVFSTGGAVSPEEALPVYLRDRVAWKKT